MIDVSAARHLNPVISLKDVTRKFQMTFIPSGSIKLNECELNLGMPRKNRLFVRPGTEVRKQETINESNSGVQQSAIPCCAIVGNSPLDHMADVVQLMA